ncbi:MAG: hypothetical protein VKK04_20050 [Synechococcales bacterium]|nr:hypothetical protein [Synechococcales bacterium]
MTDFVAKEPVVAQNNNDASEEATASQQPLFSQLLQNQTAKLLEVLKTLDSGITYENAASAMVHLLITLVVWVAYASVAIFALVIWIWGNGFQQGREFRQWMEAERPSPSEAVCALLEKVALPFRKLYVWADAFVKKSFG